MVHNANLLYRKHAFRRVQAVADKLIEERMEAADQVRECWLQGSVLKSLQKHIQARNEKKVKVGKADVFSTIRLKLSVFRALAIHTLAAEKARLAYATRR